MSASGAADKEYEFVSENLALDQEHIYEPGIRGTRLKPAERLRDGRKTPGGTIVMHPTYAELVDLLPRIVSAASAQSGYNTYTVSDTQPAAYDVTVDRIAKVFRYTGCRTSRATFRGSPGRPLELTLEVEALTEVIGNAGTFPSLTISGTPPFVWHDGVVTIGGTTYQCFEWECTIDWMLKLDRFVNSQTRTDLPSMGLTITNRFTIPYTSTETALYNAGVSGFAAIMEFTYLGAGGGAAGTNLKYEFAKVCFPARKSPIVASRDEVTMELSGEAYRSGSTAPLIVSLDSTP
jgi:hypothetical protein